MVAILPIFICQVEPHKTLRGGTLSVDIRRKEEEREEAKDKPLFFSFLRKIYIFSREPEGSFLSSSSSGNLRKRQSHEGNVMERKKEESYADADSSSIKKKVEKKKEEEK